MAIEIVCPSYGRTGTKSMHDALEILGFAPCYHMYSVYNDRTGNHAKLWLDGYKGRGIPVKKIFEGYKAVTDWPGADFYQEILREYPRAKVILSQRDPNEWWASVIRSIHLNSPKSHDWGLYFLRAFIPRYRQMGYMVRHIATLSMEEEEAKTDFIRHNEEVKAYVPGKKLLEFSVKQGWEPLCKFLEVPVPDVPFPRSNSREDYRRSVRRASLYGWAIMVAVVGISAAGAWVVSHFAGKKAGATIAAVETSLILFCLARDKAMRMKTYKRKEA